MSPDLEASVRILLKALLAVPLCLAIPLAATADQPDDVWRQFRAAYPYHYQTVALTGPQADGTRILIVSEPPPHVFAHRVQECAPLLIGTPQVKGQRIGHDGWLLDLV